MSRICFILLLVIGTFHEIECLESQNARVIAAQVGQEPLYSDNELHIATLPVGQGSAHIIECLPTREITILDLGKMRSGQHWCANHVRNYLLDMGAMPRIYNFIITHQDFDHFCLLKETFPSATELSQLKNIFISCSRAKLRPEMLAWVNKMDPTNQKVITINNGSPCGSVSQPCNTEIDLCPRTTGSKFKAKIIWANQECPSSGTAKGSRNMESLVVKIEKEDGSPVTVLFPGDLDNTANIIAQQGSQLRSTAYIMSHHGSKNGNQNGFIDAIRPQVMIASGNPYYHFRWGHPACEPIDYARNEGYLCPDNQPGETCLWFLTLPQDHYTCGYPQRTVTNNKHAVYTTIINDNERNILHFYTIGDKWRVAIEPGQTAKFGTCEESGCLDAEG